MMSFTRDNKELEAKVNQGLALLHLDKDFEKALWHMRFENVPFEVARRVLLSPHKRRDTDWK